MIPEVESLFDELADLDAPARDSYFIRHAMDPAIRQEVEALLAHDKTSNTSLVLPIMKLAASALPRTTAADSRRCGPYELIQLIGRGGMGAVFRAERADGEVRQNVAVKLMQGDNLDPLWRQRFLQERQILASLSHPGIAGLLDAGHTAEGQPYFVMELVEGRPVDEFCEGMSPRQKIEIFLQICAAVSFAHSRLVVHRDIKPGNILVTAGGVPKLLDFGIAKILGFDASVTQTCHRVMTPAYGSPEQASGGEVTTASDTYSLGAVLYKMLTGHAPQEFDGATPEAMLAAVLSRDATRASRFRPELRGDLDAILSKALRKEPRQRYATVEQLSSDLRSYLHRRPICARQGEFLYRTGKFIRRSWIPLTAALVVVAALTIGLVVAWRARQLAERRFRIARDLAGDLFGVEERVRGLQGSTGARQYIADQVLHYLNDLSRDNERDLLLELAEAYRRTANVLSRRGESSLGRDADAFAALDRGNGLLVRALAARPRDRGVLRATIENRLDTLILLTDKNDKQRTAILIRELVPLVDKFVSGKPETADLKLAANAYVGVRRALTSLDRNEESRRYAQLSVQYSRRYAEHVRTPEAFLQYAGVSRNYASFLRFGGQLEQSDAMLADARQTLEKLPEGKGRQVELSAVLYYIGLVNSESDFMGLDRPAAAIPSLVQSMDISRQLMSADLKDHNARVDFVQSEILLAGMVAQTHPDRALRLFDEAWEVMRAEPEGSFLRAEYLMRDAAESTYALREIGRTAEARRRLAQVRAMFFPNEPPESTPVTANSPAEVLVRAEADLDAAAGNPRKAIATYLLLLRKFDARGYHPRESLTDAIALSRKQARLTQLFRQAHDPSAADLHAAQRLAVWQHWNQRLPNNSFVTHQLADAQKNSQATR